MKKWLSFSAVLGALLCLSFTTTFAQGTFVKVFPDTSVKWSTGINNTIAVDGAGNVWLAPYSSGVRDTLINGTDTTYGYFINVYNPNGTLNRKVGPVVTYNGNPDTLFAPGTGYGMCVDHEGNIVVVKGSLTLLRFDHQTDHLLAKMNNPIPGYASSMTSPMCDDADEVFITSVLPTSAVGPVALAPDFSSVSANIDTSMYGAYSRNVMVTGDGNDVYVGLIAHGVRHYHSDLGTLGSYTLVDTVFKDLVVESAAWQPGTHYLWVSSGNVVSGMPTGGYSGYAWYGFDMTDRSNPVLKDSILWNGNTGIPGDSIAQDPRPRGIAFSLDGSKAYVAAFGPSQGFCQEFSLTVGVVRQPNVVANSYSLSQNYPNPFNPSTQIRFSVAKSGFTTLKVYNILGEEVATLVSENLAAGQYSTTFDASRLASGTYLYVLASGNQRLTNKMILLK
jgi:hypothetical protein